MKQDKLQFAIILQREATKNTGEVAVTLFPGKVTPEVITNLKWRNRYNPELRFFITSKAFWISDNKLKETLIEKIKAGEENEWIQEIK